MSNEKRQPQDDSLRRQIEDKDDEVRYQRLMNESNAILLLGDGSKENPFFIDKILVNTDAPLSAAMTAIFLGCKDNLKLGTRLYFRIDVAEEKNFEYQIAFIRHGT